VNEQTMATVAQTFGHDSGSVRAARQFAVLILTEWRRGDLVEPAGLLVSELTTNAVRHGHSNIHLVLRQLEAGGVRVEAYDRMPVRELHARRAAPLEESGRGLSFVDTFAARWGWHPTPSGKCVWFELD
jgi:anti-sigma regulatory factor (Ser/Thr protein kinase)